MSTVIIVDSACDVPERFSQSKSIAVLPINILLGDEKYVDNFDSQQVLAMMEDGTLNPKIYANSDAASKDQIIEFLKTKIIPNFDWAIVETVSSKQSDQNAIWREVNQGLSSRFKEFRSADAKPFQLSIIDSKTAYAGQGLLALETIRLAKKGIKSRRELLDKIKQFPSKIQAYSAAPDVSYLRHRALQRGDNTINFINSIIGKVLKITPIIYGINGEIGLAYREKGLDKAIARMMQHAIDAIQDNALSSPIVNLSYSGPLDELHQHEKYQELVRVAKQHSVNVFSSTSCISTAINLGPKSLGMALAIEDENRRIKE
ncbi:DegV family protein [Aurantivibrio plasticivorans]